MQQGFLACRKEFTGQIDPSDVGRTILPDPVAFPTFSGQLYGRNFYRSTRLKTYGLGEFGGESLLGPEKHFLNWGGFEYHT
ncbi:MAG: hypothetical protein VX668_11900 [Planctomycetota bacterium]|nr:hypothetical protein [Planctomycetota bacterium]